jgi:Holliday junction resolvase RusA-like endonuclease
MVLKGVICRDGIFIYYPCKDILDAGGAVKEKTSMKIDFTVPGDPIALKRHRTYTKDKKGRPLKFPRQVDPSVEDKSDFLAKAMENRPDVPFNEPLRLELMFYFSRPQSHYRSGKLSHMLKPNAPEWHIKTPDADNLAKFVCDSLNGVYWKDDSCICFLLVTKRYGNTPRVEISISTIVVK